METTTTILTIDRLSHEGRGIANLQGKTIFVENALPGEVVEIEWIKRHSRYDEAKAFRILEPSPERIEARCPHFTLCGGCSLQHMQSHAQIHFKQQALADLLEHIGKVQPQQWLTPIMGPQWHYRRRARLGVKYVRKKQRIVIGFREKNSRYLVDLTQCSILAQPVSDLIPALRQCIQQLSCYEHIPQIEVAVADDYPAFILRHLQPLTEADVKQLTQFAEQHTIYLYLQPKGYDSIHLLWPTSEEFLRQYHLAEFNLNYSCHPADFIQINAAINQQLVRKAMELLTIEPNDGILDLFCGLGNFSLPLAQAAKHVVGVEGDVGLIERARLNANNNAINNIEFHVADLTKSCTEQAWIQVDYDKILLDPPRAGAIEIIQQLNYTKARTIVYISCNPATLARDANYLVNELNYELQQVGVADMFPHTNHVETIAVFTLGHHGQG